MSITANPIALSLAAWGVLISRIKALISSGEFGKKLLGMPSIEKIVSEIHSESDFSLILYGGASLDILLHGQVSNDLDFLLEYRGPDIEQAKRRFLELASLAAQKCSGE